MANKWVYMFSEGDMTMRNLLGGKGANLAEMTSIGLPVPQGFTITTEACTQYYEDGRKINDEIMAQAMEGVKKMEEINGKKFGDLKNPLLVSVRSGARASMPGMMDTILNLAEEYVKSACGRQVDLDNPKAHTVMLMLVGDYYENRSPYGQTKYSQNVSTMLMQLQLETPQDTDDEVKE